MNRTKERMNERTLAFLELLVGAKKVGNRAHIRRPPPPPPLGKFPLFLTLPYGTLWFPPKNSLRTTRDKNGGKSLVVQKHTEKSCRVSFHGLQAEVEDLLDTIISPLVIEDVLSVHSSIHLLRNTTILSCDNCSAVTLIYICKYSQWH